LKARATSGELDKVADQARALREWFREFVRKHGVKHHEPSPEAYAYVEKELGVTPAELCLIACHTWDTLGAVAAGRQAALIKRNGNDVLGVGPQPHIVGNDLNDVADQLITRHTG
jgi:2-haloacid dehalogenase